MIEAEYKRLKKQYEVSKEPPTEEFLCKVAPTNEVIFGIKADKPTYGIYSKEQNGYKRALEYTAIPKNPVCENCNQEIKELQ